MQKPSLRLSMQPDWRLEINLHKTPEYQHAMSRLALDDSCSCYFCGAKDGPYLELHHLDGDHSNFDMDKNVVLACSMCHRYHHLGLLAYYNQASCIYLPNDLILDKINLSIMNRAALFYGYLNADKAAEELPIVRQIIAINETFKRHDSYEVYHKKIEQLKELKEIRKAQQTKIRSVDEIKEEAERKAALARIETENKVQDEEFEAKYNVKLADIKRLSDTSSNLERIKNGELLYLANDISPINLAEALSKIYQASPSKFEQVLTSGLKNNFGEICVWFNKNIMQSLNGEYTIDQKMHYLLNRQSQQLKSRRNIS